MSGFYEIQISEGERIRAIPSTRYRPELPRGKRSLLFTSDRETDVKRVAACNQRRITYPRYVEIARDPARRRARIRALS